MKFMKKTVLAAILSAASVTAAQAQKPDTLTLDLQRALDIALSDNPTIKVAGMEIERYDYVRRETMGNLLPSLSAGGQYTYSVIKQEMSKGLSFGADNTIAATADLTVPLFAPAVYAMLKMNATQKEAAVESARASRIELTSQVKKAFYVILLSQQSYQVLMASEATIREVVENTRAMYASGLASEFDLLTAEVQLSNLQPTIIQTRNSIETAKQMLKMFLSIPAGVAIKVEGTLDDQKGDIPVIPDPSADLSENPEMRALEFQSKLVRHQIRLANTARMPVVALYGSFIFTGNDMQSINFGSALGDMASLYTNPAVMIGNAGEYWGLGKVPDQVLWNGATAPSSGSASADSGSKWWWQTPFSVGVRLSIPIFAGFTNTNKVKQLRNTASQIELQKEYLRRAKQLETGTSVNNLVAAHETMLANEKTVAQAEKAYRIAKVRFEAGSGTMLEVNNSELNVTTAKLNRSQAVYDYLSALADYQRILGREE